VYNRTNSYKQVGAKFCKPIWLGGSVEKPSSPNNSSRRSQQQEDNYFRVLRMLQANPDMTQREIANELGISSSGLNYCLNALINKGLVKVQSFSQSKNKFGYIYVLTPQGIAQKAVLTSRFLQRKLTEYEALQSEIASLQAEVDVVSAGEMRANLKTP
jgi:EPS-associated MarR family transcriptional regulator